jgi:hypothetical protein
MGSPGPTSRGAPPRRSPRRRPGLSILDRSSGENPSRTSWPRTTPLRQHDGKDPGMKVPVEPAPHGAQGPLVSCSPRRAHHRDPSALRRGSEERVFRGLSLIRNPYYHPKGFNHGMEPILS